MLHFLHKKQGGMVKMEQRKYMNISRLKTKDLPGFRIGDHIIVQEKVDGANFSFRYDVENDRICSFSRRFELNEENNLSGAWEWSQKLNKEQVAKVLGNKLIMFAEWLVPHTVKYPEEKYYNAYCFDVRDAETGLYLPQEQVAEIVRELGLIYVPVFYDGPFTSWEDLEALVGKTELGGEYGEGIVIKNMARLNDPNERFPFYTKIVGDAFAEKKTVHRMSIEQINVKNEKQLIADSVVTIARVRKIILKMVDERELPENWIALDQKIIMRKLSSAVYYDCVKEEPETVEQVGKEFGKFASIAARNCLLELMQENI